MSRGESSEWIVPTTGAITLPAVEILTGRGFITGKSGSGKSNSASVVAEELLENNYNLLIVDPEGEYYGLKEQYELLHVGNDEFCDVQVRPSHAEKIAEIALNRNMPVILDVSDYLDGDEAEELITNTILHLYQKEKDARKPFLLMVEEMQEYLPQQGGQTDLSELLERVAKRGRKRGLGILGMSQRPSSVDKDFITQCDWMVWHRLNWKTDLDVVRNVLGSEKADALEDFETGEGYLMTDWDDSVERVQFKRKRTHDAGATPGLESYDRPDMKSVSSELVREIQGSEIGEATAEEGIDAPGETVESLSVEEMESSVEDVEFTAESEVEHEVSIPDSDAIESDIPSIEDPEDASRSELEEAVVAFQRQNRIQADEIRELRSILQAVESRPEPSEQKPVVAEPERNLPAAPTPPSRPRDRSGVGGNLIEFMEMVSFIYGRMKYRFSLAKYRLSVPKESRQNRN